MKRGIYDWSHDTVIVRQDTWASQENSGNVSRDIHPMVLREQAVLSLTLAVGQWPASEAPSYISVQRRPRSPCQSTIWLKYFYEGPEGWGPTHPASNPVNPCSNSGIYSPAPNRSGVIQILSKVNVTIIISVCQAPTWEVIFAYFLQLFWRIFRWVGGGVYRPLWDSLDRAGLSSQKSKHEQNILQIISGCS